MEFADWWSFNGFLDKQEKTLIDAGASIFLVNFLMVNTIATMGRLRRL